MRTLLAVALLALPALAQEKPKGTIDGEHKAGRYTLIVPSNYSAANADSWGLWACFIPPNHTPRDYVRVWATGGSANYIAIICDLGVVATEFPALTEKIRADYPFNRDRIWLLGYGEGGDRAANIMWEAPDVAAGCALVQAMVRNVNPQPAGRSTAVYILNDVGCTYASVSEAHSLESRLKELGYDVAFKELKQAKADDLPSAEFPGIIDWAAKLKHFKLDDLHAALAEAFPAEANPNDWRPKIRGEVTRFLRALGDGSPDASKAVNDAIASAWKNATIARDTKPPAKGQPFVLAAAKFKKLEAGCLLLCESGELDAVDDSVVFCNGDLKLGKVNRSLVFAKGAIDAKEVRTSVVSAGGRLKCAGVLEKNTIFAPAGAEAAGKCKDNWFVNTAEKKIKVNEAAREVKRLRLPGAK